MSVAGSRETDEATKFAQAMPTPEQLMPPLDLTAIEPARGESARHGQDHYVLAAAADDEAAED